MKTKTVFILMIALLSLTNLQAENIKALLIFPGQYGANTFMILEKLDEFGWDVTISAVNPVVQPCFWGNQVIVDTVISEINNISAYDCLLICPSRWWQNPPNAYDDILSSQEAIDLIIAADIEELVIYATCGGVRVLAAADIIDGMNVTGTPYYQAEYIAAGANYLGSQIPPVIDGNIVTTTRSQYYFNQNPEAIKTALENQLNNK